MNFKYLYQKNRIKYFFLYFVISCTTNKKLTDNILFEKDSYAKELDYFGLKLLKGQHLKHYKYFPDEDTIPTKKEYYTSF